MSDFNEFPAEILDLVTDAVQMITAACSAADCTAEVFAAASMVAEGVILQAAAPEGFDSIIANAQGEMAAALVKAWKASAEQTWT